MATNMVELEAGGRNNTASRHWVDQLTAFLDGLGTGPDFHVGGPAATALDAIAPVTGGSRRIVLVEDQDDLRALMREVLELSVARGELRIGELRARSAAAHAAARAVDDPAAVAAARACGQAAATAHMAAHARGAAAYAAKAVRLAQPEDATAAADETRWQLAHASEAVRGVLRTLPSPPPAGVLGELLADLQAGLATPR